MKIIKDLVLYIGLPLVVLCLFIWQLDNLEKFFKKYPHAVDGGTLLFVLITTTISIIIAYKSYKTSTNQVEKAEKRQSELVKRLLNNKTQHLRTRINTVNLEYFGDYEIEGVDLLYMTMNEKDTQEDIKNFIEIIKQIHEDKLNQLTLEDEKLVYDRVFMLNSLLALVNIYMDRTTNKLVTDKQLKEFGIKNTIQKRIDEVTQSFK
ncbi:hypothetical protein [Staphylococcus cohnii]|uniref:hypothetical protein n=1 Tax=Staphylococcus cohnii TaxID=29382 RepID=UPI0010575680|nr:hypothetical protein [Staphylococcus cohnii]